MARISAFGTYVPEKVLDNAYFESIIETNDEWIVSRTGIRERRMAGEDQFSSDLCVSAVKDLTERSGKSVDDVDFIIVASTSPDQVMPNTASRIQIKLNIQNAGCNDIYGACAGFVYGLQLANGLVEGGMYKKVLVVGAETLTKVTDYADRTTCILFGDGAGAVLVEPGENQFLAFNSGTSGQYGPDLYLSNEKNQIDGSEISANGKIVQNGRQVFKWAVSNIPDKIMELVNHAGLTLEDIDYIIPHSANLRILEGIAKNLNYPMDKVLESVTVYGNTSAASIPLAIERAMADDKIKEGDIMTLIGFGGGLTFAGCILRWGL